MLNLVLTWLKRGAGCLCRKASYTDQGHSSISMSTSGNDMRIMSHQIRISVWSSHTFKPSSEDFKEIKSELRHPCVRAIRVAVCVPIISALEEI